MSSSPFAGVAEKDVVDVLLGDERLLRGAYLPTVGLPFLHFTGPDHPPQGTAVGPLDPRDVRSVTVIRTRAEILAEARLRSRGDPFPGSPPRMADEYRWARDRRAWGARVAAQLDAALGPRGEDVVLLAGQLYRKPQEQWLGDRVRVPMRGLGIGQQKAWFATRVAELRRE